MLVERAGGRCRVCGYDRCINNLHFHHVDPAAKSFNMTMASGKSEAAYLAEAAKCVLVCANCHGEIEAGLIESPPAPGGSTGSPSADLGLRTRMKGQLSLELAGCGRDHDTERDQAEG